MKATQSDFKRKLEIAKANQDTSKRYEKLAKLNVIILLAVTAIAIANLRMTVILDNMFASI